MGIEEDPGHPIYYYNLAGADAKEKMLKRKTRRGSQSPATGVHPESKRETGQKHA